MMDEQLRIGFWYDVKSDSESESDSRVKMSNQRLQIHCLHIINLGSITSYQIIFPTIKYKRLSITLQQNQSLYTDA